MSEFDKALQAFLQDMDDQEKQARFFDLFLNTTLYVPTCEEGEGEEKQGKVAPLVLSADGRDYLMLFDTEQRLTDWAQQEAPCVAVPGHAIAANTPANLHWMLNYGCEPSKQFTPQEIAWLQKAVAFSKAQNASE
ncbi:MAG: SseB family protein [Desulfuromonadales bacterium]|nr:SseB family protein [Desulfuromonadales bacterium]NIR33551.1 SseB family protein [Desulfuromonadales bacterium]NIS41141.1 SseB family protein [Desulfuromonadales bacterium]